MNADQLWHEEKRNRETPEEKAARNDSNRRSTERYRLKLPPGKQSEIREADTKKHAETRANMSPEEKELVRRYDKNRKQNERQNIPHNERKQNGKRKRSTADDESVDSYKLGAYIKRAVKIAKRHLHRTKIQDEPTKHQCHVCIVCDRIILGTESLRVMTKKKLKEHKHRLGVHEYEQYHGIKLPEILVKQYRVKGCPGMLLSPRARRIRNGWTTCAQCKSSMTKRHVAKFSPPVNSIANGFAGGQMPNKIKGRNGEVIKIDPEKISDELRALLAPVRPYGNIYAYQGGAQKAITGTVAYYEMDLPEIGGAIKHSRSLGLAENMYVMLCGRFTPQQRTIIQRRFKLDSKLYFDLLNWFIRESGHPGFRGMPEPKKFPTPVFVADDPHSNNTDETVDPQAEKEFVGGNYYLSTAQDPSVKTSVFQDETKFARAMLSQKDPTLLAIGGQYANMRNVRVEDILPFVFPFGIGGPGGKRRSRISQEACFQRYFRLSTNQFMRGDAILILGHMYNRLLSFKSGVMICRSQLDGVSLGEALSRFSADSFKENAPPNEATEMLLKAVNTSCAALGHTAEAAKVARKSYFAYTDHFGLNSVFFSISPNDSKSFRVRLFADASKIVSSVFQKYLLF